jgi:hypothetical protein
MTNVHSLPAKAGAARASSHPASTARHLRKTHKGQDTTKEKREDLRHKRLLLKIIRGSNPELYSLFHLNVETVSKVHQRRVAFIRRRTCHKLAMELKK